MHGQTYLDHPVESFAFMDVRPHVPHLHLHGCLSSRPVRLASLWLQEVLLCFCRAVQEMEIEEQGPAGRATYSSSPTQALLVVVDEKAWVPSLSLTGEEAIPCLFSFPLVDH
jgi:hypothetical protein